MAILLSLGVLVMPAMAGETTLRDTVLATLKQHPYLQSMEKTKDAAAEDYKQARGGYFPKLDAFAQYGAEAYSDATTRRAQRDSHVTDRMDASLTATQLLWDGHGTEGRVDAAQAAMRSAESQFVDVSDTLGLDAVIAHVSVYRQQLLLALAQDNVTEHQDILASMEERERAGGGSLADVTQTRGRLARAMTTLSATRNDLNVATANYFRMTGMAPEALAVAELPGSVPANVDKAATDTLNNNPKLSALMAEVDRAVQVVVQNESNYYPEFNLKASSGFTQNADSSETYTKKEQLMVTMDWNLFNGGSDVAGVQAAKSRKLAAELSLRDMRESLMESVAASWSQYEAAREQVKLYEEAVEYNRQTRDMYSQQFTVGQRSLLDVLDAENELFNTQGQLITAQLNVVIGGYRLITLSGNILPALEIDKAEFAQKAM
ncbi:TolC family outer membrane protein [Desulfovibrio mangrovi]|uniref:TolC family outer membrane protein n=1 Tax=Desulfovibrio mangrovi TaxID=2976983 RepID=UPI0022461EF7|nr:TolC family outer membrane protein [Desulfovibrio mangrovi]UZP66918.1 TolC family outer membrane protein [Desulfovibrio mangrovi]